MKKCISMIASSICCIAVILAICSCDLQSTKKEERFIQGSMAYVSESELILRSDIIVAGSVYEILESKWTNPDAEEYEENMLYTDIVIGVDDYLSGEIDDDKVVVRIYKGEDGNTIVHSDGYPDFFENEQVLLFLSRDDGSMATDEDYYVLTGMRQGKYVLSPTTRIKKGVENYYCDMESEEERVINLSELPKKIIAENEAYPNYKEEEAIRQEEIITENKRTFGE